MSAGNISISHNPALFFGDIFCKHIRFCYIWMLLGGVSPEENLHSDEPGVGWEALGGLNIAGCHRAGRGHVCMELPGAHGCRPVAEGHQRRGFQSGFGWGLSGDVSQCPQAGELLFSRLLSLAVFVLLSSSSPLSFVSRVTCGKRGMCVGTGLSAGLCWSPPPWLTTSART